MKPGSTTSEFWVVLAGMACVSVLVIYGHEEAVPHITGLVASYLAVRGGLKITEVIKNGKKPNGVKEG